VPLSRDQILATNDAIRSRALELLEAFDDFKLADGLVVSDVNFWDAPGLMAQ
jgi:hypothetical protein